MWFHYDEIAYTEAGGKIYRCIFEVCFVIWIFDFVSLHRLIYAFKTKNSIETMKPAIIIQMGFGFCQYLLLEIQDNI